MRPKPTAPVPRVALTIEEAAAAIGCSPSHFKRHVQPELRIVRSGSTRLVPVAELEQWTDRAATLAGGTDERKVASPTKRPRTADTAGGMATYMGHGTIAITYDRYGHLMPGSEVEVRALLDAYLDGRPDA